MPSHQEVPPSFPPFSLSSFSLEFMFRLEVQVFPPLPLFNPPKNFQIFIPSIFPLRL